MDLSKLPKLSETPRPPAQGDPPPAESERRDEGALPPTGGEVWISIAVGLIMLFLYPRFLQWVFSRLFGTHFNEFVTPAGEVVPYPQMPEFWADLGPTLFGIALLLEGLVLLFAKKRAVLWVAFVLMVGTVAYNLVYAIASYSRYGLAMASALAVVFGVYIAMHQWRLLTAGNSKDTRA